METLRVAQFGTGGTGTGRGCHVPMIFLGHWALFLGGNDGVWDFRGIFFDSLRLWKLRRMVLFGPIFETQLFFLRWIQKMEAGAHDLWVSTAEREREKSMKWWSFGVFFDRWYQNYLLFWNGTALSCWPSLEDAASLVACKSLQLEVEYLKPTQFLAESMSQTQVLRALTWRLGCQEEKRQNAWSVLSEFKRFLNECPSVWVEFFFPFLGEGSKIYIGLKSCYILCPVCATSWDEHRFIVLFQAGVIQEELGVSENGAYRHTPKVAIWIRKMVTLW